MLVQIEDNLPLKAAVLDSSVSLKNLTQNTLHGPNFYLEIRFSAYHPFQTDQGSWKRLLAERVQMQKLSDSRCKI